jgi:hypothetical protein
MNTNFRNGNGRRMSNILRTMTAKRGLVWGVIIVGALLAFEVFNYSTTEFALGDVLGTLKFLGIRWSTILALAFCGIDFAGIARLFTPETGRDEPAEVWYLFGAWLLAAAMNATLTWWGVSVAIVNHSSLAGGIVVSSNTLTKVVPVFVAIMVWLIRVLIIGTFSVAGERLFTNHYEQPRTRVVSDQPATMLNNLRARATSVNNSFRPAPKVVTARPADAGYNRQEPTYHNVSLNSRPAREAEYVDTPRNS